MAVNHGTHELREESIMNASGSQTRWDLLKRSAVTPKGVEQWQSKVLADAEVKCLIQ